MAKEVLEMEIKSNTGEVTKDVKKLDKATNQAAGGFKGIGSAIKGIGTALKAAGIGLLVALLAKLMEVFSNNQKTLNFFNTGMTALSIAFNDLFKYLDDNYETVKGYLKGLFTDPLGELAKLGMGIQKFFIEKMEGAVMVLDGAVTLIKNFANPQKFAEGLAKISAGIVIAGKDIKKLYEEINTSVTEYTSNLITQAKATTEANNAARLAEGLLQGLIEKNDLLAETQRQIRDDERKTFAERIEANQELGRILDKQEVDMLKVTSARVKAAKLELDANKTNIDLQVAYQQALNEEAAVKAQIAGFRSEQLTNEVSLNKELLEIQNELTAAGLAGIELELAELEAAYKIKLDLARKAGIETTAIDAQYAKQRAAIVKANVETQIDAYAGLASALIGLAGENKELAVASAVIDTFVGANKALGNAPPPLNYVNMAAVIATGLANVQKILSTPVPNGGGGGGGITGSTATQAPAPQMMSGAFDLSGGVQPDAMRAYVVTDEMTNSQNQLANIRRRSTI